MDIDRIKEVFTRCYLKGINATYSSSYDKVCVTNVNDYNEWLAVNAYSKDGARQINDYINVIDLINYVIDDIDDTKFKSDEIIIDLISKRMFGPYNEKFDDRTSCF